MKNVQPYELNELRRENGLISFSSFVTERRNGERKWINSNSSPAT